MQRRLTLSDILDISERQGSTFEASRELSMAGGSTAISLFRTGSKPVILFARDVGYEGEGVNVFCHRDPTITDVGTLQDNVRNPNDINPKTSTIELYGSTVVSDIGAETRSPKNIFSNTSNVGSGDSVKTIETPQIMLPNKDYILSIENRDNQTQAVFAEIRWCELNNIPNIQIVDGEFEKYTGIEL